MRQRVIRKVEREAQAGEDPRAFPQRENRGKWLRRFSLGLGWLLCVTLLSGTTGSAVLQDAQSGSASALASVDAGARVALDEGARFVRDLQIIYQGSYLQPLVVEAAAVPAASSAVCKTISTHDEPAVPKSPKSRS